MPGDGKSPIGIKDDGDNGIFIYGEDQNYTHLELQKIPYEEKAAIMSRVADEYMTRMGMTSGAHLRGGVWIPLITDNDGQWTGEYGAGELMRYAVLRDSGAPGENLAQARESALKAIKGMLLLGNIAGRDTEVDAKIRYSKQPER